MSTLLRSKVRFTRWTGWLLFGLCAPLIGGGLCFDPVDIPETETCRDPGPITADSLTILDQGGELPLVDGQELPVVVGGQGLAMLPFRIRVEGDELPECMLQRSSIVSASTGEELTSYERGVVTESTGETDVRRTGIIWYGLGPADSAVKLRVEVGDLVAEVLLWSPGSDQTPVVESLNPSRESVALGEEVPIRVRFDRPSPPDGTMTVSLVAEPEGSFALADDAAEPTDCSECFAQVQVPPNLIEYEVNLRAELPAPSGAALRAYTNFQSTTAPPATSVVITPGDP